MKIEKINDNQVKFIIGKGDLAQRNIAFSELEYGSEKAHELFQDMMEQAYHEHSFDANGVPLMVEAFPITMDTLMVIVTKVADIGEIERKLGLSGSDYSETLGHPPLDMSEPEPPVVGKRGQVSIFYFNSLDDIIDISQRLERIFTGKSAVYKYNGLYYLVLEGRQLQKAGYLLSEYGQRYPSNTKSKYHLMEHGQTIIGEQAVQKLAGL